LEEKFAGAWTGHDEDGFFLIMERTQADVDTAWKERSEQRKTMSGAEVIARMVKSCGEFIACLYRS
jgi:hypothetical protein